MALLTSANYPAIRSALDASLDSTILPDAVIAYDIYHRAAELEVLTRDPDAETRTGDDLTRVRTAAMLYCAAFLAPAIPMLTREEATEYAYTRQAVDWQKLAATLRARADALIEAVLTPDDITPLMPTMFVLGAGGRGR